MIFVQNLIKKLQSKRQFLCFLQVLSRINYYTIIINYSVARRLYRKSEEQPMILNQNQLERNCRSFFHAASIV